MKNLIIYFKWDYNKKHWNNAFFDIPEIVQNWFMDFFKDFENNPVNIYICRWDKSYIWNGEFNMGFKLKNNNFILENKIIISDFIFNRSTLYIEKWFNNNWLIEFCKSKKFIIKALPKYSTKTYFIKNKSELQKKIWNFSKNWIKVIKPLNWSRWENIIITKSAKKIKEYQNFPCLLQKFINTSIWIPNIYKWVHDLRIIILNWKIVHAMYRTPWKEKYISNTSKWWVFNNLKIKYLKKEVIEVCLKVDNLLKKYKSRYYAIDIWYTKKWINIFELNSSPLFREKKYWTKKLHNELYKFILEKLNI